MIRKKKANLTPIPKHNIATQNLDTKHDLYPAPTYPTEYRLGEGIEAVPDLSPLGNDVRTNVPTDFPQEYPIPYSKTYKAIKKVTKQSWKK